MFVRHCQYSVPNVAPHSRPKYPRQRILMSIPRFVLLRTSQCAEYGALMIVEFITRIQVGELRRSIPWILRDCPPALSLASDPHQ